MNRPQIATLSGTGWSVSVTQEWIDVTVGSATWREGWRYTDHAGHEHRHVSYPTGGYPFPTMTEVVDESHWCDGDEGYAHHDPHEQVDGSHWECLICHEVIKPATDPPFTPKSIPGTRTATLEGWRNTHEHIVARITEDEYKCLTESNDIDTAAFELAESLPDERIISREWRV